MTKKLKLSDFDFDLPKELIAQTPVSPRDHSRLLILDKVNGQISDKRFYDIADYLKKGDVLVMNNSKVFPARLFGKKVSGGKMEVFLHRHKYAGGPASGEEAGPRFCVWQCLIGGRGAKENMKIYFDKNLIATILKDNQDGTWELEFNLEYREMMKIVEKIGQVPLPPYIKRTLSQAPLRQAPLRQAQDKQRYQTVYADDDKIGSVAAPTAGLHFTSELLDKLKNKGVQIEYVTLHVGLGTFAPVKTENISEHKMHAEYVEVEKRTIERIARAKKENNLIITVGTTSTRALEAFFNNPASYQLQATSYYSWVNIFILPGYKFKIIDGMITNFHLPKSTLIMLVSALAGKENIDKAYRHATDNAYRFFSYGDAMLIV